MRTRDKVKVISVVDHYTADKNSFKSGYQLLFESLAKTLVLLL